MPATGVAGCSPAPAVSKPLHRWLVIVSLALFGLAAAAASLVRRFNLDEFEALHTSWKMLSGETIYVDFLQHHHFLLYHLLGAVIALFGADTSTIIAARLLMLAMAGGIVWITHRIALLVYGRDVALLSAFFLASTVLYLDNAIEIRPDVPMVLCTVAAVWCLARHNASRTLPPLLAGAVLLFVSFLFLQKGAAAVALVGLLTAHQLHTGRLSRRDFCLYWGVLGISSCLFVWYVSAAFTWPRYYSLNWTLNARLLNAQFVFGDKSTRHLLASVRHNPLLWVSFVAGVGTLLRQRSFGMVAFLALGLLGFTAAKTVPHPQYYLLPLPFIAIIAARGLHPLVKRARAPALLLLALTTLQTLFVVRATGESNRQQLARIRYVLAQTDPGDRVYDGQARFNLFRKDIGYFWFGSPEKWRGVASPLEPPGYDLYRLIEQQRPKIVSNSFIDASNPAIARSYTQSGVFGELYVRNDARRGGN